MRRRIATQVRPRTTQEPQAVPNKAVYGNRDWVPPNIYGTTSEFLEVREWDVVEGEMFSERDVRNGAKICLVGQTLVRELFDGRLPLDEEIRIQNVPFRVIGVLSRKGASRMGTDQDDVILAPWTTIKYRVANTVLTNANQSAASKTDVTQQVNTLNKLYPSAGAALFPTPSAA